MARLSQRQAGERKKVNGTWVTVEPLEDEIIAQAIAVKTARNNGLNRMIGRKVAHRKAPRHRKVTGIASGMTLARLAKEKLGPNA